MALGNGCQIIMEWLVMKGQTGARELNQQNNLTATESCCGISASHFSQMSTSGSGKKFPNSTEVPGPITLFAVKVESTTRIY